MPEMETEGPQDPWFIHTFCLITPGVTNKYKIPNPWHILPSKEVNSMCGERHSGLPGTLHGRLALPDKRKARLAPGLCLIAAKV